jgi:hypothetical protein
MWQLRCMAIWTALLLLLMPSVSCRTSKDSQTIAAEMTLAAKDLRGYYDALTVVADDHAKLERLQKVILDVPLDAQDQAQLQSIREDMRRRAQMAESLEKLSAAFTELSGSKAPGDVSQAAASLGAQLADIPQLPGASFAPDALQNAGKILTQFALEHDERKMAANLDPTMAALAQMFVQEKPAYDSIYRTYIGVAQSLALELVKRNQVDPGSLLAPALEPFGLTSRMPQQKLPQGLSDYAREEIPLQGQQRIAAQAKASEAMETALHELSARIHELATQGRLQQKSASLKLADVESWNRQMQESHLK